MTFPTPTTAGVFLSGLSDKIKSAITGNSVNHCLIGPDGGAGIWLRNNAGFHGALAKMADALLERAVLPYQITATLPSMSSLKDGNFTGSDEQPIQFLSKISLPPVLSNHLKRSRLGKEKRMAPLEFWNAILGSINELGRSSDIVMRSSIGEPVSDERYADAVIYPSCMRPMSWTAWWGAYSREDITDSGWTSGSDWPWSYSSPVRFVYDVCRMSYVEHMPTMNMLSQIPFDFSDEEGGWYFEYWDFPWFPFIDWYEYGQYSGLYGMLSTQTALRDKLCRSAVYLYDWGPNLNSRSNTARPNIDLLRMYQVLLGCFWANWAKLAVDIRVAHRTTEITYRYSVDFGGNITQTGSPSSSSSISYMSNVLTWSHDVTWSASGAWSPSSHSELFSGSAEFCPDACDLVDPSATAEIEAYSYEAEKAEALANLNDAKDAVRSQEIRDQLSDMLKQGFDYVDPFGRTISHVSANVHHGGGIIAYGDAYSKEACDNAAAAILDSLIAQVEDIRYVGECDVDISIRFSGGSSYTQRYGFDALGVALNEMKEAYDDYQYVLTDPGVCKDISLELGGVECTIEWDDKEPDKPGVVTLEATSVMTEPIDDDGYEPKAYILRMGGASFMRESPWPARVLFDEGYVGSMNIALGGRICDRLVYGCYQNNSGFYSIRNGRSNYVSERTPTEFTFRRLFFDSANVASNVEAPSEAVESIVGSLIDNPDMHIVGAAGLGGHLPLVQYEIFPEGAPGVVPSSTPEQAAARGITACYHPTKSPKIYYNQATDDCIITEGGSAPSGYSFLGYGPWRILDSQGEEVWKYESGSSLCFSIGFDYILDGHSQTARVKEPPYDDGLTVDLSRHIAVRAVWDWKSMPVQL